MNKVFEVIQKKDKKAFIELHWFVKRHPIVRGALFLGAEPLLPFGAGVLFLLLVASRQGYILSLVVGLVVVCWCIDACVGVLVQRQRPYTKMGARMRFIAPSLMKKSFPSEHTALAVIVAWGFFLVNPWWGIGAVVGVGWVALGRVGMGMHYPLDIVGGITTSVFTIFTVHLLLGL